MSGRNEPGDAPYPPVGFPDAPRLRPVSWSDVRAALRDGLKDVVSAPFFGLLFASVLIVGGWFMLACLTVFDTPWAIIPLAVAFPLIGPFLAVGLYDVSRRRSRGLRQNLRETLSVVLRQKDRQLAWMAFITLFILWMWAYQVRLLLAIFLGAAASVTSLGDFAETVFLTENGLLFLGVGAAVGVVLATALFSTTVISMPMLVDQDVDLVTAMACSVAVVRRNPAPMLGFGCIVAAATLIALAPAFLGLLLVFPVLGHATWRLYERAVAANAAPSDLAG